MNITLIAAVGISGEIGKDNKLIWKIPEDLKFFKETTLNHSIIMGRKTYESLPKKLPNRKHIVLSNQNLDLGLDVIVFHSIEQLLLNIKDINEEIFVIGGAKVYQQFLNYASKMILTEVNASDKNADAFFPKFNVKEWEKSLLLKQKTETLDYERNIYIKKKTPK